MRHSLWGALVALGGLAAGPGEKVTFVKFDQARQQAAATGRPIAVYVAVNPDGSA